MGLFNHGLDGPTFHMREKIFSIGDDFWIEDADGNKVYKVNGKAIALRETFILEDPNGNELSKIQKKKLAIRETMTIEHGAVKAKVKKGLIGIREHYEIEVDGGEDLKAHGDFLEHEYVIERGGKKVAEVSKKILSIRQSYGIRVAPDQDIPLLLAISVCVDEMPRE